LGSPSFEGRENGGPSFASPFEIASQPVGFALFRLPIANVRLGAAESVMDFRRAAPSRGSG
jgi:hypothetical protein